MIACGDTIPKWKHEPLKLAHQHPDVVADKEEKGVPNYSLQSTNYSNHEAVASNVPCTTNIIESIFLVSYSIMTFLNKILKRNRT